MSTLNFIEIAKEQTIKSSIRCTHGAVIANGKRILSRGFNHNRTQYKYFDETICSCHAERDAVMKLLSMKGWGKSGIFYKPKMKKYTLYVVRWSNNSGWGNSKPCESCINFLQMVGIGTIIYTTGDNELYKKERVKNLNTTHMSSGMRSLYRN